MSALPLLPILCFVGFGALVVGLIIYNRKMEEKLRLELAALAERLGLQFNPEKDYGMPQNFPEINPFHSGDNRYASHCLFGLMSGYNVKAFHYHYETESTNSKGETETTHHQYSCFVLQLPRSFPALNVSPENIFSKVAQAFGYDDIDFESKEFSDAFCVRSPDKKFAYDVCNPQMIDYLLNERDLAIEVRGEWLALVLSGSVPPAEMERNLGRLVEVRQHWPAYLMENPV
jgi:hypothetical protein